MPELAEAETIARALARALTNRSIKRVGCSGLRLHADVDEKKIRRAAVGATVSGVGRRGKAVLIHLDNGNDLLIQLGMSGKCRIVPTRSVREKHEHVWFDLSDGNRFAFIDPRRFGMVDTYRADDPDRWPDFLQKLGPEPLGEMFTAAYLQEKAKNRTVSVKELIMNQTVVAGVGNIYAAESLYRARVQPLRPAGGLTKAESKRLVTAIRAVLEEAISAGGTTIRDYTGVDGTEGSFTIHLDVYGRAGQLCAKCGSQIENVVISGRASCYCPRCQK